MSKLLKNVTALLLAVAMIVPGLFASANPQVTPDFSQNTGSLTVTRIAGDVEREACTITPENPICDALVPVSPVAPGYAVAGVPIRIRQVEFANGVVPTQANLDDPAWMAANATFIGEWRYQVTGANGEAVFNGLPLGHYLVQELEEAVIGGETVVNPTPRYLPDGVTRNHFHDFVVGIPRWVGVDCLDDPAPGEDEDCEEYSSGWLYDVRAYPKSGLPEYEDGTKRAVYYSGEVATWELAHQIPNAVRSVPHFSATDILPAELQFITGSVVGRFTARTDYNMVEYPEGSGTLVQEAITDWNLVTGRLLATHFDVTTGPGGVLHIAINAAGRAFLADNALLGEGEVMFRFETRITEAGTHRNNARWDIGTPPWDCPPGHPDCPLPVCTPDDDYYPTCIPPCLEDDPTCNETWDELSSFELHILKTNVADQALAGAEFRLYRELTATERTLTGADWDTFVAANTSGTGENLVGPVNIGTAEEPNWVVPLRNAPVAPATQGAVVYGTTNADGVLIFSPVSGVDGQARIWIRETEAPDGYMVLQEWVQISFADGNRRPGGPDSDVDFYYIVDVTVINDVDGGWRLPDTGGMGTIILTVVGLGLVGGSLVLFLGGKKEEEVA